MMTSIASKLDTFFALTDRGSNIRTESMAGATADEAHLAMLGADIGRMLHRPGEAYSAPSTPGAPPGAPIGQAPETWVDPLMSLDSQLPPLGSLLDILLPAGSICSWEY